MLIPAKIPPAPRQKYPNAADVRPTPRLARAWPFLLLGLWLIGLGTVPPLSAREEKSQDYQILALSWHPAFCVKNPGKKECRAENPAAGLVLHGLWPEKRGGGSGQCVPRGWKSGPWCRLKPLGLKAELSEKLARLMPGTRSCLQRYQWEKHGKCHGFRPNDYFQRAVNLHLRFAQSRLATLLNEKRNQTLGRRELIQAFSSEFGRKNSKYFLIYCQKHRGRSYLRELRFALRAGSPAERETSGLFLNFPFRKKGNCPKRFGVL